MNDIWDFKLKRSDHKFELVAEPNAAFHDVMAKNAEELCRKIAARETVETLKLISTPALLALKASIEEEIARRNEGTAK